MAGHTRKYYCSTYGNGYFTFVVDSYETFLREIAPKFVNASDQYVWRGMLDPSWSLQSSLSRELAKMPLTGNRWKIEATKLTIQHLRYYLEQLRGLSQLTRENGILYSLLEEEISQNYFSFTNVIYKLAAYRQSIFEVFSLGQHHDMLTPFLDWTTTPSVALYFAFEEEGALPDGVGDRVVYALSKTRIEEECPTCQIPNDDWVIFTDSMAYDNPRIIGQKGLFSYIPANEPLDRWVVNRSNFRASSLPVLIRFIIPNKDRLTCLRELSMNGIDARSVYPDLQGAAQKANSLVRADLASIK